jgi:hypothetical protein
MTLRYVYGQDETVARFVAQLIPHVDRGFPWGYQCIGVERPFNRPNTKLIEGYEPLGSLIAGIVYYNWNKKNGTIEVAVGALPGVVWFTRETMKRMAEFAFKRCGCQMAIMRVRAEDERLLGQLARFGCMFVAIPRLYGRDSDGVMALLTAEAYAEHPALHRNEIQRAA